jgi:hypothetical protein
LTGTSDQGLGSLVLQHVWAGGDIVIKLAGAAGSSKFAGKIQAFLEEYLVAEDPTRPTVFGGRDDELERLNRWLQDDEKPPRFVLAAPAGRGKSAILVHWIGRLETKGVIGHGEDCWRLVFVPISIRFRTNRPEVYYEAIARGIAEILDEDLAPPRTDPAAYYEDQCRMLLEQAISRNQRILTVIDGLDEALGERFSAAWFHANRAPVCAFWSLLACKWAIEMPVAGSNA